MAPGAVPAALRSSSSQKGIWLQGHTQREGARDTAEDSYVESRGLSSPCCSLGLSSPSSTGSKRPIVARSASLGDSLVPSPPLCPVWGLLEGWEQQAAGPGGDVDGVAGERAEPMAPSIVGGLVHPENSQTHPLRPCGSGLGCGPGFMFLCVHHISVGVAM